MIGVDTCSCCIHISTYKMNRIPFVCYLWLCGVLVFIFHFVIDMDVAVDFYFPLFLCHYFVIAAFFFCTITFVNLHPG